MANESSSDGNIDIEQSSVAGVLNAYWIHVPTYQRDYAWEKREVQAYLDDVTLAIANDDSHYFLGTIVTIRRGNDKLEVVDGQQRLATTALILAAMKSSIESTNINFAQLISNYLQKVSSETLEPELKMSLNIGDNSVFKSLVLADETGSGFKPIRTSHQNLKQAYLLSISHFAKNTSALSNETRLKWFQNLV